MEEPHESEPDLTTLQKTYFWFLIALSLFLGCFGFLGFLGWSQDPSNQKWYALAVSFVGFAGAFVLYNAKHEVVGSDSKVEAELTDSDAAIAKEPPVEQLRYWKEEIIRASSIILIFSVVGWAIFYFLDALTDYRILCYLMLAKWWYSYLRRLFRCVGQIRKLNRHI